MRVVRKAFAYVTSGSRLLLFTRPLSPEAGIQVPAGSMRPGERPADAALREAIEETGLTSLRVERFYRTPGLRCPPCRARGAQRPVVLPYRVRGRCPRNVDAPRVRCIGRHDRSRPVRLLLGGPGLRRPSPDRGARPVHPRTATKHAPRWRRRDTWPAPRRVSIGSAMPRCAATRSVTPKP